MVPVPARRWVEAGRAARLARSVGTDLGESRELSILRPGTSDLGPQTWERVVSILSFGRDFESSRES